MEFDEQEEELGMAKASYDDSLINQSRVKMPSPGVEATMLAQPMMRNSGKGRYRECLKNHAVGFGGHELDGCREFMAAGAEGTLDSLKCAACNCHRNFHRKETDTVAGGPFLLTHHPYNYHHIHRHQQPPHLAAYYPGGAGYLHVAEQQRGAATLALPSTSGAGGGTQSTRDDQEDVSDSSGGGRGSKMRFRTKFTQEQKDKMLGFAERLDWNIQKHDKGAMQEFCNETGVKRHVLKVWIHKNRHTLFKKP